jgi:hypothetical protein
MSIHWDEDRLPDDITDVARLLRDQRSEASALELDRMKQRARSQALRSSRTKGNLLKSRLTVALLSLGLMAGGTGGVIAAAGGVPGPPDNGAASSQYKPGVGPCKNGGVTPSGTHTGAPGNGNSCATK